MIRFQTDSKIGLTQEQVDKRIAENLINYDTSVSSKSIKSIIFSNFFTIFNLINLLLGIAVFSVGSYKNVFFLIIAVINTLISTLQEIHSKKVVDKLSVIASTKIACIRDGKKEAIGINDIVLDDILLFKTGNQVVTDSIIQTGEVEVNESFITGESDTIVKKQGDMLLSGSFITSGNCIGKVEHIAGDNYTAKISSEAKYIKTVKSEIITSLNKIIRIILFIIIPVGTLLFMNQLRIEDMTYAKAVVNTVAALVGMIPEGLILLTSTVMALSVIKLSQRKVLVQELYCMENLARVDTLCLDKTGTLTQGKMEIKDLVAINDNKEEMKKMLATVAKFSEDTNATIESIRETYQEAENWIVKEKIAFSSSKKWSGICFEEKGCYIIGSPEFVLREQLEIYQNIVSQYTEDYRVIALAHTQEDFCNKELPKQIELIGFVLMNDKIRNQAEQTLQYFKEQGVAIKIISGDNPITVSKIAQRVGVDTYDSYIDCQTLKTQTQIEEAANTYTVFGRVSPSQKKELILALKKAGHTVAMTGDGVNDVLALKEADCSISIASGSDAARNVSQLVLLNNDFDSLPNVVAEGRQRINNIQRSSTLFLVKTIYATVLAVLFLFISMPYPFEPIHFSLINLVTIGIPSFFLALEPNKERVKGHFLRNVFTKAIPSSITVILSIILIVCLSIRQDISHQMYSTLAVIVTTIIGFMVLIKISIPFNKYRTAIFVSVVIIFIAGLTILKDWFSIFLVPEMATTLFLLAIFSIIVFLLMHLIFSKIVFKK